MAILHAGGLGRRIRQATHADVETSTHRTAGLDGVAVPDEWETGLEWVINTHPKGNSVGDPCDREGTTKQGVLLCRDESPKCFAKLKIL